MSSEEYCDRKFKSDEWAVSKENEHTIFHYDVLLGYMPDWLKNEISNNKMSICDLGCGIGEGINLLKECFLESEVTGVNFSQSAIKKAGKKYSDVFCIRSDIDKYEKHHDVIISSHTLEHFENPSELFSKMIKLADKYFVLIIPFQKKGLWREHSCILDYNFFPISIQDHQLVHYKEIDKLFYEAGDYWVKEQILVVYANTKNLAVDKFSLEQLNNNYFNELKLHKRAYKGKLDTQKQKYTKKISEYEEKLNYQNQVSEDKFYGLNKEVEYYQKNAKCLQKKHNINITKIKNLEENALYTKKQLMIIANTKPYRIAYFLRRFSHEFLRGNISDKKNFIKWIYCKLAKKDCGLESEYNPIFELVKK